MDVIITKNGLCIFVFPLEYVSNAALNAALVLSSKNWTKCSRWGAASKNKSKKPWASVFTLPPCGNRCRFGESALCFSQVHPPSEIKLNNPPFFSRARKKGFSFFPCGATPSRTVPQNPAPAGCLFPTFSEKTGDLMSQKEGILGKNIAWARVGP